jgi:hypothetical protein
MTSRLKQILLGTVAAFAILIVLDMVPFSSIVPSPDYRIFDYFYVWPAVKAAVVMSLAGFGGAYIAKVRFVAPSVSLATAFWVFVVYISDSIAETAGQGDILAIAGQHSLVLVSGTAGAVIGALLGRHFCMLLENVSNAA